MKLITISFLFLSAVAAHAQPVDGGDVILKHQNGRIITGRVENGTIVYGPRLVGGTFGDIGIPNATFSPGFDSEVGAFPAGQAIGLTIRKALRKWNGVDFSNIPAPPDTATLNIVKNNITVTSPTTDPVDCQLGGSLVLGLVNGVGKVHEHPAYQLVASGNDTGIYLVEIQLWMSDPVTTTSDPQFILFNQNESIETFAAAFAWADAHRAGPLCYANCDSSTAVPTLNANDFNCFLNKFAAGSCDANCDGSTSTPTLNANDFNCFLNKFAAGCA